MNISNEYWINRWQQGETAWHQTEVEPALIRWFSEREKRKVFVPLCGKSLDLKWLIDQGHHVVGCELSEKACEDFVSENALDFTVTETRDFKVFKGKLFTLFNGDIFKLSSEVIGNLDAIYDRAALIALDETTRKKYAALLKNTLLPNHIDPAFEWLQIILTRTPTDSSGPPHSVTLEEIQNLYGSSFKIELLNREKVDMGPVSASISEESVLMLRS
jgi:thiopurine S-methyltransferase